MPHNVLILESAGKDLEAIWDYLCHSVGHKAALKEIEYLEAACATLSENPQRGSVPRELESAGVSEYRQILSKSYRIIFQVVENNVFVFGILHGRRNVQEILRQRLLIQPPSHKKHSSD